MNTAREIQGESVQGFEGGVGRLRFTRQERDLQRQGALWATWHRTHDHPPPRLPSMNAFLVRKGKNMEGKTGEKIGKEIRFYKVFLYRRKKKEENKHEISGSMY